MMVADVLRRYLPQFESQYGHTITPDQWPALNAILGCRSGQYGQVVLSAEFIY